MLQYKSHLKSTAALLQMLYSVSSPHLKRLLNCSMTENQKNVNYVHTKIHHRASRGPLACQATVSTAKPPCLAPKYQGFCVGDRPGHYASQRQI